MRIWLECYIDRMIKGWHYSEKKLYSINCKNFILVIFILFSLYTQRFFLKLQLHNQIKECLNSQYKLLYRLQYFEHMWMQANGESTCLICYFLITKRNLRRFSFKPSDTSGFSFFVHPLVWKVKLFLIINLVYTVINTSIYIERESL